MIRLASAVLAIGLLAGCVQPIQPYNLGHFPALEYDALKREGTGTVTGQLFLKTVGGDVKFGAGEEVILLPVTSYSQKIEEAYNQNRPLGNMDSRLKMYNKTTQADGNGNFTFSAVPAGDYYAAGKVNWQAPTPYGLSTQGGYVMRRVSVSEGQTSKIILTK